MGGGAIFSTIGFIIIYFSSRHNNGAQRQKLREAGYTPLGETSPANIGGHNVIRNFNNTVDSGIKCSNCGNVTGTMNSFCPHCGSKMK